MKYLNMDLQKRIWFCGINDLYIIKRITIQYLEKIYNFHSVVCEGEGAKMLPLPSFRSIFLNIFVYYPSEILTY